MSVDNKTDLLKTHRLELMKSHSVFDGSSRLIEFYEAQIDALNGGPALKTTYTYDGGSGRIENTKEEKSTWNSAWDI